MLSQNAEKTKRRCWKRTKDDATVARKRSVAAESAERENASAENSGESEQREREELAQTKENASLLEKDMAEQTEKVRVLKLRLVKNERARKKLETKVERYREALKMRI